MSDLKSQLIKLGSTNPELRPHIREIVKVASKITTHVGTLTSYRYKDASGKELTQEVELRETKLHWVEANGEKWSKKGGHKPGDTYHAWRLVLASIKEKR